MRQRLLGLVLTFVLCLLVATLARAQGPQPGMAFLADVTVTDDSLLAPNAPFIKTWLVQNTGGSDWPGRCTLAFLKGDPLGAEDSVALGKPVRPGESIGLSVAMRAPAAPGRYTGWWQLRDDGGRVVGAPLYVRIMVGAAQGQGLRTGEVGASGVLTADNPFGVWVWSAPRGQHDDGDSLPVGAYPILQQTSDGEWTQVRAGARSAWVYSGANSGTHLANLARGAAPQPVARAASAAGVLAAISPSVPIVAPAALGTPQLLDAARRDVRQAVEMWKARLEWRERQQPANALATNDVPGITKGPDAIYRVIDAPTTDIMVRLPYALSEPILYVEHLGVFVPGRPPLGGPGPPVPLGVEALTDKVGDVSIRYDYLSAPNPNFPMPAGQWPKIRRWALLAALAHEGRHIMVHNGENHEEAVTAQKAILLAGALEFRVRGDGASAAWLERLAAVVRSGSGNPVTGAF